MSGVREFVTCVILSSTGTSVCLVIVATVELFFCLLGNSQSVTLYRVFTIALL